MKYKYLLLLFAIFYSHSAYSFKTDDMRVGLMAGQVGMLQDVGTRAGSTTGYGGFFNYINAPDLMFEVGYLKSEHTDLSHTEIPIGFNYYFDSSQRFAVHLSAGVDFITNILKEPGIDLTSSGFGVYLGAGIDFDISRHFKCGFQARYVKGFEQTVQLASGDRAKSLQDNYIAFFRLMYEIKTGGSD